MASTIPLLNNDDTWDYRLESSGGDEYLKEIAFKVSQDVSGIQTIGATEAEIFYSLGLVNYWQINDLTDIKQVIHWELWKESGGTEILVQDSSSNTDLLLDDLSGQTTISFAFAEDTKIKSSVSSFTVRLYSVKFNSEGDSSPSGLPTSQTNPGDQIINQATKNKIGYLGGFRILFTYSSDLQSYSVQMVTINAEDLVEETVNIADFFSYHSIPDKNAETPNETIFVTNDISGSNMEGQIRRSQLVENLGAISYNSTNGNSNVVFTMNNIQKRIRENAAYNHTTFGDVYGTSNTRFTVSGWSTELTLIDTIQIDSDTENLFDLSGALSSSVFTDDIIIGKSTLSTGYHWRWNSFSDSDASVAGNSNNLQIVSPAIDLSSASLSEWSLAERLDFLSRTNFAMFFNHRFTLTYANSRGSQSANMAISMTRNINSGIVKRQPTLQSFAYPNTLMNSVESTVLNVALQAHNKSAFIAALFIIFIVMNIKS